MVYQCSIKLIIYEQARQQRERRSIAYRSHHHVWKGWQHWCLHHEEAYERTGKESSLHEVIASMRTVLWNQDIPRCLLTWNSMLIASSTPELFSRATSYRLTHMPACIVESTLDIASYMGIYLLQLSAGNCHEDRSWQWGCQRSQGRGRSWGKVQLVSVGRNG